MDRFDADVAVLGAGFGGSLTALILSRVGLRVVLIERGRHPRFALGESSTPIADFVLARLARRYDLPRLLPLCKYGTWKQTYPEITCGCKRGFSYFQHERGRPFAPRGDHGNELLVAASPSRAAADTQWYRADVDHFFVREAVAGGAIYLDETDVRAAKPGARWVLAGARRSKPVEIRSRFVVDATGSGRLLAATFGLRDEAEGMRTTTRSVFSHFRNVKPFVEVYKDQGGVAGDHPFPCDEAAQHHLVDNGWMWVLRFDNGVTSAGLVFDHGLEGSDEGRESTDTQWGRALANYPSIAAMFEEAEPLRPLAATGRLQRRWSRCAGEGWAMLPSAAYTLDPLHSTGIAHNLLGVERLAEIITAHLGRPSLVDALRSYEESLRREIEHLDRLVHGCYASLGDFPRFTDFSMLYFLAATYSEHRCRHGAGAVEGDGLFLLADDQEFTGIVNHFYGPVATRRAGDTYNGSGRSFTDELGTVAADYNVAGLCDPAKKNMYPFPETATESR